MSIPRLKMSEEEYRNIYEKERKIRELESELRNDDLSFEEKMIIRNEIKTLSREIE